jgi:hypothetical protein
MKRIPLYNKIYDTIYSLSYNAEGQGLIDKHYCIAAVSAEKIVKLIQGSYRRRKR